MSILIIFNRVPYDGTDVTWNGLRLAEKLLDAEQGVRIFLINAAVDLARDASKPPEGYDHNLSEILKSIIARWVIVKVCGTCMARCGIYNNQPYFEGTTKSTMNELAEWVVKTDKIITFWNQIWPPRLFLYLPNLPKNTMNGLMLILIYFRLKLMHYKC